MRIVSVALFSPTRSSSVFVFSLLVPCALEDLEVRQLEVLLPFCARVCVLGLRESEIGEKRKNVLIVYVLEVYTFVDNGGI